MYDGHNALTNEGTADANRRLVTSDTTSIVDFNVQKHVS